MTQKNPLQLKAAETIKFLKDENLITKEHSFTIALILELAAEWSLCNSSTQRAGISKELRAAYELLPKPEATVSDEAAEFLASLSEDD
ncbi:hypothetical protein CVCC1112_1719 [Paenarthrobacter nicotinovorans]|uniref:hypothetical protein n=1 Tax=Paenarthrobacter nicotinovorans TaxID=29320 RepID=UPI0007CC2713|nr:hypothetical protein [Paenarthrobacter nicotinovorans]GAT87060.1 hypothetical protein CVCC1112_1719 [Paenarthrobacter nicotinovorans]